MRPFSAIFAAVLFLFASHPAFTGDAKKDTKNLQGAWLLTELVVGGAPVPEKDIKGLRFVFKADKLTILAPPGDVHTIQNRMFVLLGIGMCSQVPPPRVVDDRTFTVKLDPTKQPAAVDLIALDGEAKGIVSPGIYEINGDQLRWCQSDDPKNTERPKTFAAPAKSRHYLFTFQRAK